MTSLAKLFVAVTVFTALSFNVGLTKDFRLKLTIDLGHDLPAGTVLVTVQPGADVNPTTEGVPFSGGARQIEFDKSKLTRVAESSYALVHGKVVGPDQTTIGFIPIQIIDFRRLERPDLIELTTTVLEREKDAFVASFPLAISLKRSLEENSLEAVLAATKIMFNERWVQSGEEWERLTSDYLSELAPLFREDSTKLLTAFKYLDEYVRLVDHPEYDSFYVELLLKLKQLGLGGAAVGSDNLDEVILSSLNRIYTDRLVNTYQWAPNTIRVFVDYNPPNRSLDCIQLSTLLMNALNGALENKTIDPSTAKADVVSFMQASTECAQEHFINSKENGSRVDVTGASRFLVENEEGRNFVSLFITLFETGEAAGYFPRQPRGPIAGRIREITKYFDEFYKTSNGL